MSGNRTGSRINGGNSAYGRRESDFYPTPPEVTQALLNFLLLPEGTVIWEPACGQNHMVDVMRQDGYKVIGTDIQGGRDYLTSDMPKGTNWIITNPPFSLAEQFIERSFHHALPFAMLLKCQYWHSKKRLKLFRATRPAYVLPLTWRPDFTHGGRGGNPLMDVMWCVWLPGRGARGACYMPLERPITRAREDKDGCADGDCPNRRKENDYG